MVFSEEIQQAGLLGRDVASPGWLDPNLSTQSNRLDRPARGFRAGTGGDDTQLERQQWGRGKWHGLCTSTWKLSSGIGVCSPGAGTLPQAVEEPVDCGPNLRTPGETAPVCANQAHQLVALVDRTRKCSRGSPRWLTREAPRRPERIGKKSGFQRRDPAMFPGSGAIRLPPRDPDREQ